MDIYELKKLTVGSQALLRYADLDYDEWYALSEFIDNSLHSYLNNKEDLNRIGTEICDVRISIVEEDGEEIINILDNAGGIHVDEFPRLLSMGMSKEKSNYQLSEFGMGMKTSAIWLGKKIQIETKHYLSDKTYFIEIDINRLGSEEEVEIKEVKSSSNIKGYTKIKISNLNRRVISKKKRIKDSLASIYKKFIEQNSLQITFLDEMLQPFEFYLEKSSDGSDLKKNFDIHLKNGKKCSGWIGIMAESHEETGWRRKSIYSGFSIYRHNRLIQGYPENSWKPKEVFNIEGGSNTLKNQRLIGELDMTDFQVAHTKNKINFQEDEEFEFRHQLGEYCRDIARESEQTRKKVHTIREYSNLPNTKISDDVIKKFISEPVNTDVKTIEFYEPVIKTKTPQRVKEIYETQEVNMDLSHMKNVKGIEKEILVYYFFDNHLPYLIMDEIDEKLIVCINIEHSYMKYIIENGTSEQETQFKLNCIFDALSEQNCNVRYGKYQPEDIRITKDLFMKRWVESREDSSS